MYVGYRVQVLVVHCLYVRVAPFLETCVAVAALVRVGAARLLQPFLEHLLVLLQYQKLTE